MKFSRAARLLQETRCLLRVCAPPALWVQELWDGRPSPLEPEVFREFHAGRALRAAAVFDAFCSLQSGCAILFVRCEMNECCSATQWGAVFASLIRLELSAAALPPRLTCRMLQLADVPERMPGGLPEI